MGRATAETTRRFRCPDCAVDLVPRPEGGPGVLRFRCPGCGGHFLTRGPCPEAGQAPEPPAQAPVTAPAQGPATVGGVQLFWRGLLLRLLEPGFRLGTILGSAALLALGGVFPVGRGWLANEIACWGDVVEALGGVWFRVATSNPDADLGPVLARVDAPLLFGAVDDVARRLGVRPPGQVRLSYLPCCGVVAWGRSRALLIGLPLLRVLTQAELRAVMAHELAHIARGDAARAARSARFVEGLEQAVDRVGDRAWGPLGAWARACLRLGAWLIEPVARGQEARADRLAAMIAGGGATASALIKVAIVQPLFREVLEHYDPALPESPNLYAFFRSFWFRLPSEVHSSMRLQILTSNDRIHDPTHPPLPERIAQLHHYPDLASVNGDAQPATTFLGDLEIFEQMLHNRLFGLPPIEPTVFHRAGS